MSLNYGIIINTTLNDSTCLQLMRLLFGYARCPLARPNQITVSLTHNPLIAANIKCIIALYSRRAKGMIREAILMLTMICIPFTPIPMKFTWACNFYNSPCNFHSFIFGKQEKSTYRQRCATYSCVILQIFYLLGHRETSKINIKNNIMNKIDLSVWVRDSDVRTIKENRSSKI